MLSFLIWLDLPFKVSLETCIFMHMPSMNKKIKFFLYVSLTNTSFSNMLFQYEKSKTLLVNSLKSK